MSQKEKLISRLLQTPKDFSFDELKALLRTFGYTFDGSRSGSRVSFFNEEKKSVIILHKPHPGSIIKPYQLKQVIEKLKEVDLL